MGAGHTRIHFLPRTLRHGQGVDAGGVKSHVGTSDAGVPRKCTGPAVCPGQRTTREYWENVWPAPPRQRLPVGADVGMRNLQRLLRRHVKRGARFLEIGCAPGKLLAWVAKTLKAEVAGVDYAERGMMFCRTLFASLAIEADLRCEDVFSTTFSPGSFSVVFSAGLIEHFDEPREIVRRHALLLRPGGTAIVTVPNYGGIYGRLQRLFDPENLSRHNTSVMSTAAMRTLAPLDLVEDARSYVFGRMSPWILSFDKRWPRGPMRAAQHLCNAMAHVQPLEIRWLCPTLVLEMRRRVDGT